MTNELVKQDINFLDKPLWFTDAKKEGIGLVWKDIDGYEYRCCYKLPDKVDMLFLLYLLLQSQRQDYKETIEISRYQILKACGLLKSSTKHYYARIEESLERWTNITIAFHGTFYDNKEYISIGFHIIDSYKIDKETKLVSIRFNPEWLLKVKCSQFFKLLSFEYYKALKRPVSRRLYELLVKNFKGREECFYKLTTLGEKLTLTFKYASDVLKAIKPAINEINKLAKTPNIAKKLRILQEDIFSIDYHIEGEKQDRVIYFRKVSIKAPSPHNPPYPTVSVNPNPMEPSPSRTEAPSIMMESSPISEPPIESDPQPMDIEREIRYRDFLIWLRETCPNFNLSAIRPFSQDEILEYWPTLKARLEQEQSEIENLAGWIVEAIKGKWKVTETREEKEKKEADERRMKLEATKTKILERIRQLGTGAKYDGQSFDVVDGGLLLDDGVLLWRHVQMDKLGI